MRISQVSRGVLLTVLAAALGHAEHPQQALRDEIVAQERAELDSLKTGDMTVFASLLADDAVFVDARGSAGKAEVVKNTSSFRLHDYTMTDIKFVGLSEHSGLIAYVLAESGTSNGKEFTAKVNVSALWVQRSGKWVSVFSQETAAK
jgi:ketosteroid isomerase-like protein